MVSNTMVNLQYGKWNAVIAKRENSAYVFAVDGLNIFPETLDEWINSIRKINTANQIFPLRMDIDITNLCNNDCIMCFASQLRQERPSLIPYSRLVNIFDDFKELGGKSVRLTGGGDCLTHPYITKIIQYLDKLNLKISIQTNGDNLSRDPIQNIIAEKAHSLRVSVNSSSNETRKRVHRAKNGAWNYDELIKNISEVMRKAKVFGRENELLVGATFIVLPENYLGVRKFVDDLYSIGVRWLAIRENIYRKTYEENPDIIPFIQEELNYLSSYPNLVLVGQYNVSYTPSVSFDKCWVSYIRPVILADSALNLCCMARNNLIPKAELGNLKDSSMPIQTVINENLERLSDFRSSVPHECKICIDPASNIFIAKVKKLLDKHPDYCFYKANVALGAEESVSFDQNMAIYKITIPALKHKEFQLGQFVPV